ncbi:hypothetical protein OPT61_g8712 [Boeremia exigua]|uniref:Uncharacterized protein n=1 Tax=Boeremia exigua TaxID=749465 RepID=A0ACC2HX32_9PLEO|nr:hypothetical protein OPT61_g8712 [Boeremia exigua]
MSVLNGTCHGSAAFAAQDPTSTSWVFGDARESARCSHTLQTSGGEDTLTRDPGTPLATAMPIFTAAVSGEQLADANLSRDYGKLRPLIICLQGMRKIDARQITKHFRRFAAIRAARADYNGLTARIECLWF